MPANGELVSVQSDHRYDAVWIGTVDDVTRRWVSLMEVRPDATWWEETAGRRLRRLTVIEINGHYILGLASIAGAQPTPLQQSANND